MSDEKPSRRELLRPLHLLGIALVCGVFAAAVTLVSTGAFTARVNTAIANGTYEGLTPVALGLVVGGGAFIVTLLILAMLMLAVDPAQVSKPVDRPVLYDREKTSGDDTAADDSGSGRSDT
jgi:amino acid transporter